MSGGGGTTQTQSNQPPQQYLDAYTQVLGQANNVAQTPYQNYPGQLQADFSPMQQQGFDVIGSAPGIQAPYFNAAAQDFTNATAPLATSMQPYVDQARQQYQNVAGSNLQGAVSPWQAQAAQGFANGSQQLTPAQYSGAAIQQYQSPYTQQVVDATQAQFNNQNAQAQNQLRGNAASQGALGGDRLGVAQGVLAGQQQLAQAPVIAGLENTGFQTAQNEFNNQQQTALTAQQQSQALQQQAAQGYAGLGGQSLTAAQQQAALQQQAGQGFAGLGQNELGAAQAQGWLNAQAGSGMAGLGNAALQGTITSGNALLGAGAQQQQQAQTGLNIPFQQWQAQNAYPYQTTGWLANIAEGLGGSSGGIGSTTTPGASVGSQIAGGAIATTGVLGATGAFGQSGWLTGSGGQGLVDTTSSFKRGGTVRGFADGGEVPNVSMNGVDVGAVPGEQMAVGGGGVPDVSASIVPESGGKGTALLNRSYPTTTTGTAGSGDSTFGTIAKLIGTAAATYWGGPAGFQAANVANQNVHFDRGGPIHGFAGGGTTPGDPPTDTPGAWDLLVDGSAVPPLNRAYIPQTPTSKGTFGMPKAPAAAKPEDFSQQAKGWIADLKTAGLFKPQRDDQTAARGGSVAVAPRGFAAGGSPAINVTTVPNASGVGVPTMTVDPRVVGSGGGSSASGSPADLMNAYLAQQATGAYHPPAQPPPTPPAAPATSGLSADQVSQLQAFLDQQALGRQLAENGASANGGGQMRRGGMVPGFGPGGAVDTYLDTTGRQGFGVDPPPDTTDITDDDSARALQNATVDPSVEPPPPSLVPPHVRRAAERPAKQPVGLDGGSATAIPSPPEPPPQRAPEPASDRLEERYADALTHTRALEEDRANPWLSVATAGFGMMAGNSPHALQNLGAGALEGMKQYVSSDKAAKDLAAKVDENRVRLLESQQYHQDSIASRNYRTDVGANTAAERNATNLSIAQQRLLLAQIRQLDAEGKGTWTPQVGEDGTTVLFNGRTGEFRATNFKLGMKPGEAARVEVSRTVADDRRAGANALQDYREAELQLRQAGHDAQATQTILNTATNAMRNDPEMKTTFPAAVRAAEEEYARLSGRPTKAAAPTIQPLALPGKQSDLVAGQTYATVRGPAVWTGQQFMPVTP